jgi:hypothetical protein
MTAFGALPASKKLHFWPLLVVRIGVESESSPVFFPGGHAYGNAQSAGDSSR